MLWQMINRNDRRGRILADRHYSRVKVGAPGYTPPGRVLVLITPESNAVWATSFPYARYVNRAYPDAWVCTIFRNESRHLATDLIRDALAATVWKWGAAPPDGMITLIDPRHVRPTMVHSTPVYGWTYRRLGFAEVGRTKDAGLIILQLLPHLMPAPAAPLHSQLPLFTAP